MVERAFRLITRQIEGEPLVVVQFSAPEQDRFVPHAMDALEAGGHDLAPFRALGVVLSFHGDDHLSVAAAVEAADTVADVYRFLGEDAAAEPPVVHLTAAGWGGGGADWIQHLYLAKALAEDAVTVAGVGSIAFAALKKARALRYRTSRNLVRSWQMQGQVSAELRDRVRVSGAYLDEAEREFGVRGQELGELFRACDMEYLSFDGGGGIWVTTADGDTE